VPRYLQISSNDQVLMERDVYFGTCSDDEAEPLLSVIMVRSTQLSSIEQ
jgi:hypothetical protein